MVNQWLSDICSHTRTTSCLCVSVPINSRLVGQSRLDPIFYTYNVDVAYWMYGFRCHFHGITGHKADDISNVPGDAV